ENKLKINSEIFDAVINNDYERVQALLKLSIIILEARNEHFFTPLHLAVYHGHIEIIKLLLEKGANINAVVENAVKLKEHLEIVTKLDQIFLHNDRDLIQEAYITKEFDLICRKNYLEDYFYKLSNLYDKIQLN